MNEKNGSFKNHMKTAGKVVYCYFLGLLMSWAGFPILSIFSMRDADDTKFIFLFEAVDDVAFFRFENIYSFYTGITTLVMIVILYLSLHEIGQNDLKPFKWARYKAKGLAGGAIASAMITSAEIFIIWLADRYVVVAHPQLDIKTMHNLLTIAMYGPLFWLYRLIDTTGKVIPGVNYLTSLWIWVPLVLTAGFGYWMGFTDKHIMKKNVKSKFIRRLIYGKQSKNWKE